MEEQQKTWGPFNGRQLTTMFLGVLVAAVLIPVGAYAVSFTNVAITDPGGVNRAKVDATGKLSVGDGSGPLSVDGAVSQSLPTKPITIQNTNVNPTGAVLYGPQSKAFGITSLTMISTNPYRCPNGADVTLRSAQSPGLSYFLSSFFVKAGETLHVTYPSPLVLTPPPGGTVSLSLESPFCPIAISGVGIQS